MVVRKTYTLDIKNPYCSKGKFLWKNNSDKTLGENAIGSSKLLPGDAKRIAQSKKQFNVTMKELKERLEKDNDDRSAWRVGVDET